MTELAVSPEMSEQAPDAFGRHARVESPARQVVRRFGRHKLAMTGLVVFAAIGLMALFAPFERRPGLAVAVSGGRDSLALALLARDWVATRGGSLVGLIVDHGLRPESATEAQAAREMLYAEVHRLFVVQHGRLIGVISTSDIVRAVATGKL